MIIARKRMIIVAYCVLDCWDYAAYAGEGEEMLYASYLRHKDML